MTGPLFVPRRVYNNARQPAGSSRTVAG